MRSVSAIDAQIGAYALSAAGISLNPDYLASCIYCPGSLYKRKHTFRHRVSRGHRKRMRAALEAEVLSRVAVADSPEKAR